jgi:hypothetical protein
MMRKILVVFVSVTLSCSAAHAAETIDVFLMAGQSNMLGRTDSNIILYHHNYRGGGTLDRDGFEPLGIRPGSDGQMGNFEPELCFGQEI